MTRPSLVAGSSTFVATLCQCHRLQLRVRSVSRTLTSYTGPSRIPDDVSIGTEKKTARAWDRAANAQNGAPSTCNFRLPDIPYALGLPLPLATSDLDFAEPEGCRHFASRSPRASRTVRCSRSPSHCHGRSRTTVSKLGAVSVRRAASAFGILASATRRPRDGHNARRRAAGRRARCHA